MIFSLRKIILFWFLGLPFFIFSQNKMIQGTITDANSGEILAKASVYVKERNAGVVADNEGRYFLSLPPGDYVFCFSYVGYETFEKKIKVYESVTQNIQLIRNDLLQEVVISSRRKDENLTNLVMGVEKLSMKEIKLMPALLGEVDALKAIQLLPGVQATSEGSSGFSVRGGSPDQNLIMLDNTTVYNPSHMMGFFSIFNNDVIEDLELYKGDLPFKFGGRLSSLLDVRTKKDAPAKFQGTGGIGLISSRLMMEGPLDGKTSWLIGGRRSYADLFLKLSSDKDLRNTAIYFYDMNAKLTHRFSENDKLELNAYHGIDNFGATMGEFYYGNTAVSLTWSHVFSKKLFGRFSANYTDYLYRIESHLDGARMKWDSGIRDWMFRGDFHNPLNDLWNLSYGASTIVHQFMPGMVNIEKQIDYKLPENQALEQAVYLSNEQKLSERLALLYGLRFSAFRNTGETKHTYATVEPGIGTVFRLTENTSVKINFSHNTQYLQLAHNSTSSSPLDVWFSASSKIKPQQANLYSTGYFHNFQDNGYEASVELYYKDLKDVIDFAEHANLIGNEHIEDDVRTGTGRAYGIEWMLKKNTGKLTGFINYTLSRSERTIPAINQGRTYLAPYDKTHAVNIVTTYSFSKKINASVVWIFATGNPTTYPTGRFEVLGEIFPIYSGRNEYRKPDYHRLDFSLNYIPNPDSKKRWKGEWNLSLYNAYNKKNPWSIYFNQEIDGTPYGEMMYLFGIVPSITYNFKF
jgi:outer membrane receptor for ferrienterochelin and colicin